MRIESTTRLQIVYRYFGSWQDMSGVRQLEYRIEGRHLLLVDARTRVIIDYVRDVMCRDLGDDECGVSGSAA